MNEIKNIVLKNIIISAKKLYDEKGYLSGINMKFSPISKDHIYITSDKKIVNYFPTELETNGIDLTLNAFYDLMLAFSNSISTYMYELRKPINSGELNYFSYTKFDNNYFFKINVTNHFFKKGNLGKDKVTLSIFEKDEDFGDNELISIPFIKRDTILLYSLFKELISSELRTKSFFTEVKKISVYSQKVIAVEHVSVTKVDNAVVIDSIWLHGQELLNLMYVVDKLLYGFEIEKNLNSLIFSYRQISLSVERNIAYLILKKLDGNDEENYNKTADGEEYYLKIPLAGYILTVLGLFLDVRVLRHADIEYEEFKNEEILDSKNIFINNKYIKYHISTKESFIGIGVKQDKRTKNSSIVLSAKVKENIYKVVDEDNGFVFDSMYTKNGVDLPVLNEFSINLREHWFKLVKGLSIAYTNDYKKWGKTRNMTKFFVTKNEPGGWVKYEVDISSNEKNKVPAILTVTKLKMVKGSEPELIASYRQPLYTKYIYQLLKMILASAEFFPKLEYINTINKKDFIRYRYKSMKKVITIKNNELVNYGFKKENDKLFWGIFSDTRGRLTEIDNIDKFFLKISAEKRIFTGDWLPFTGNKISIGPDRYLTDLIGEVNLEKEYGDGSTWATNIYFATTKVNPMYLLDIKEDEE